MYRSNITSTEFIMIVSIVCMLFLLFIPFVEQIGMEEIDRKGVVVEITDKYEEESTSMAMAGSVPIYSSDTDYVIEYKYQIGKYTKEVSYDAYKDIEVGEKLPATLVSYKTKKGKLVEKFILDIK